MEDAKVILATEELNSLKQIQSDLNTVITDLGNIEVQSVNLKEVKEQVLERLKTLRKSQQDLGATLNQKYGTGTIDLESGEFIKTA